MALQTGLGGRNRILNALAGKAVGATPLYLSLYFATNASSTAIALGPSSTLSSLSSWEILPTTGGGNVYTRQQIDLKLGTATVSDPYNEITNGGVIDFTIATVLAQTASVSKPINQAVISVRTGNTTEPLDIIAYGALLDPVTAFTAGDTIRIAAGELKLRQA
jgi:hypothetical protein